MQEQENLLNIENRTTTELCISSLCQCNRHILFWDFDNIDLSFAEKSLSSIQAYHGLGDIYIIKSSSGYNAFCLDKFFLNEAYNILYHTRWNDFQHVRIGYLSESWALRIGDDKELIKRIDITENYKSRKQSNAHYNFFKKIFDFEDIRLLSNDELEDVVLESYKQNRV